MTPRALFLLCLAACATAPLTGCGTSAAPPADPVPPPAETPDWMTARTPVLDGPLPGTTGLTAESCGTCHPAIYAEWSASTHAHAWVDPQFQVELAKDPEVAWMCRNCHTPVANQLPELVTPTGDHRAPQRAPNPSFDPDYQQEGITCLACHWRPEGIAVVHEDVQAPHPTVVDPSLRSEALCTSCHQAVARLEDALVCTFNTGNEWAAAAPGKTCPECHMPRVDRDVAVGGPVRHGGRHTFPGSLIPKDAQSAEEAALYADWECGLDATLRIEGGEAVVDLTNARAGHMLPSGDPERYLEVTVEARAPDGDLVSSDQWRIGQVWEWWPVAKKVSDNRLAAGETRTRRLSTAGAEGGQVRLQVDHVRISPENHAHHNLGDYPARRTITDQTLMVPRGR